MAEENNVEQEIAGLQELLKTQQDTLEETRKAIQKTARKLQKVQNKKVVLSEAAKNSSLKMTPMDDIFFNKMSEDKDAIEEVISTVLGVSVIVREVIPQYTITGIGNRGVRLDSLAKIELPPETLVKAELCEDCFLGKKGAIVNIEVQKDNNDDAEYRVFYNGASIVVNNTPKGTERFADIQRAVVIYISEFDIFDEGEMYYEVQKTIKKSGTPRRSPVTEIYINTVNRDESNEHMKNIADLIELFKHHDTYDNNKFPKFSQRKYDLKHKEEGRIEVGTEVQKLMDDAEKHGREMERKDTAGLMGLLASSGRSDDIIKASTDESYLNKLLNDYRSGILTAN